MFHLILDIMPNGHSAIGFCRYAITDSLNDFENRYNYIAIGKIQYASSVSSLKRIYYLQGNSFTTDIEDMYGVLQCTLSTGPQYSSCALVF